MEKLSATLAAGVRSPHIKERLLAAGLQPTGTTSTELGRILKADSELWAPAVRASSFTPEQ
jgi:tripartite-type tricarboxylate transporter receptor subunit TctC